MGAENSKPASGPSQHIFSSDAPVRFSNELVDSLQKNTFTDSTRLQQQELQYQQRLTAELEKLRDQEAQNLVKLTESLSAEADKPSEPSITERLSDATSSASTLAEKQKQKDMSRDSVTKEIQALKKKLEGRKKLEQVDPAVNKAKDEVVACLRIHDRRPLDCWQEIENFKKEVGRLEKGFIERTLR